MEFCSDALKDGDLHPLDDFPTSRSCQDCGSPCHFGLPCPLESKSWASTSRLASPSCTSDVGSSTDSNGRWSNEPDSNDLDSPSEGATPSAYCFDQWSSSPPDTMETKYVERKLSGSKLSRLLLRASQARRDPRRKPSMSRSATPATPSDPDMSSPMLRRIKREAHRNSNSDCAPVDEEPRVLVKQEVIEGEASAGDVDETPEQSWELTIPQTTTVLAEYARQAESGPNDSCGNSLPSGLLDFSTTASGSGGGVGLGQTPGQEPFDFERVQGLYNLLMFFESTAKTLRNSLAPYLSLFPQSGFPHSDQSQSQSLPFPFIHTPVPPQPVPPPLPPPVLIPEFELSYAPDPVFAQDNLLDAYDLNEGASSSTSDPFLYPLFQPMVLDTKPGPLPLPTQPLLPDASLLPTPWTDNVDALYSNFYSFGTSALGGPGTSFVLEDILDTSALYLPEDSTACISTAKSSSSGLSFVDTSAYQPGLPEAGAPNNALDPAHGDSSDSPPHTIAHTSSDTVSNIDITQPSTLALDAPSNAASSRIACEVDGCGKTFRRPYLLRDHMRSHSGESTAHRCQFKGCGKSFGSQSNLTRHQKTHSKKTRSASTRSSVERDHPYPLSTELSSRASARLRRLSPNVAPAPRRFHILEPRTPGTVKDRLRKKAI